MPSLLAIAEIMFEIYVKTLNIVLVFILATILSLFLLVNIKKEKQIRAAAVYFRSLLIQVKQINNSKKHSYIEVLFLLSKTNSIKGWR